MSFQLLPSFRLFSVIICFIPGLISSSDVTLESIEIFTTHELLTSTPTVYFQCKRENKTVLPDVKEKDVLYKFNGQESWQPLTEFPSAKCKRCGLYEQDTFKQDDVFDEWEICPDYFHAPGLRYTRHVEKEYNATFTLCKACIPKNAIYSGSASAASHTNRINIGAIVICSLVLAGLLLGAVIVFKYWQKKRRQQEQARILKLFDEGDEAEEEFGLRL